MNQAIIVGTIPTFHLSLTRATVLALIETAKSHYDGVCKSYAGPDGVLTQWERMFSLYDDEADTTVHTFYRIEWRTLDTIGKICEMVRYSSNPDTVGAVYFAILQAMRGASDAERAPDMNFPINV